MIIFPHANIFWLSQEVILWFDALARHITIIASAGMSLD